MEENKKYQYKVINYSHEFEQKWDWFVMNDSVNGTFLQTRRFLNYHPSGRFTDSSLIVLDNRDNIVAVCPAGIQYEGENKIFFSHKGSTYGGIIIARKVYSAEKVIEIVEQIEKFLVENGFKKIVYKITPEIFCTESSALLEYVLYYENYEEEKELNLQIEYDSYKEEIISNLSQGKRTHVHNCQRAGLMLKKLVDDDEIKNFYEALCLSLEKYSLKPVHTMNELLVLKNEVLKEECEFFGLYQSKKFIAGSMMFYFNNVNVAHAQYLCALPDYNKLSPVTYMYYCMAEEMKKKGFKRLSWGISSEHGGKVLNMGLTGNKESYGSKYSINRVHFKEL